MVEQIYLVDAIGRMVNRVLSHPDLYLKVLKSSGENKETAKLKRAWYVYIPLAEAITEGILTEHKEYIRQALDELRTHYATLMEREYDRGIKDGKEGKE